MRPFGGLTLPVIVALILQYGAYIPSASGSWLAVILSDEPSDPDPDPGAQGSP